MDTEKVVRRFFRYEGKPIRAKREIPYEMGLQARLLLDEVCFLYNKDSLENDLNKALIEGNKADFMKLSEAYKQFLWE